MGVVVSPSHVVFAAPSSLWSGLTLFPCSSVWSCPHETVLNNFSTMSPSHRLQFSMWIIHRVVNPASKPALWVPLLTEPQVLPGPCFSTGFTQGYSLHWTHPPVPVGGHTWAADVSLLHHTPAGAAGECAPMPAASPNSGVCRVISLTYCHSFF